MQTLFAPRHSARALIYVISNSFAIRRMPVTAGKGVKAYE